jgi:AcrR family transcriptional regulator
MRARAASAAATAERVIAAARNRFGSPAYDEITLEALAADAGVTVQTVLRRFGSKEGVVRAAVAAVEPVLVAQRDAALPGDVPGAVANLVEHYELCGDLVMQLLRQELRVPVFAEITGTGRAYHASWIDRVFAPWLAKRTGEDHDRLRAQLGTACDVYTWHLLRRRAGLTRAATEQAIRELLEGVLP